jgi:hypothetical protein
MTEPEAIREEMERVGELLAELPVKQWAGWALYLLEVLDGQANARGEQYDYLEVLIRISSATAARLELGRW